MNSIKETNNAFSLVELMVVIAIIGILSAIAVPSYKSYVIKSRATELVSSARTVQTRIMDKYNSGSSWNNMADLGFTSSGGNYLGSTYVANVSAAPSSSGTCPGGSAYASITTSSNTTALGLPSGTLTLVEVACIQNDVITWVCGYGSSTTTGYQVYLPANCQTAVTP